MREKEVICPICGKSNLHIESYYEEGIGVVEEHRTCPTCDYLYKYAYGQYFECFDGHEFAWHYLTKEDFYEKLQDDIRECKQIAKEKWKNKES